MRVRISWSGLCILDNRVVDCDTFTAVTVFLSADAVLCLPFSETQTRTHLGNKKHLKVGSCHTTSGNFSGEEKIASNIIHRLTLNPNGFDEQQKEIKCGFRFRFRLLEEI